MIFYGSRATNIRNGQIINVVCPNCEKNTSMIYSVFAKYGHVYWIPFFPMDRITVAECNSCKKTYEYKDLSENIQAKLQREKEKSPVRYPIWMFSGLFIILGLIGFGFYDSKKTDINNADYIKNPKVGDVYYIKASVGHYTTFKVDKISRTEVYITSNDYEIDLESDIYKINISEYYTKSKDTLEVMQLQGLFKDNTIIEIVRD